MISHPSLPKKKEETVFMPPLFDRLVAEEVKFLDEEGVKASVFQELMWLFNTRLKWKESFVEKTEESGKVFYVLPDFFGIEDFSNVSIEDGASWEKLKKQMQNACRAYEPRLKNPQIHFVKEDLAFQKLTFQLSGILELGARTLHVTFPLALDLAQEKPHVAA